MSNATSTSPYIQYKCFSPLLVNEQVTGYLLVMSSSSLPRFSEVARHVQSDLLSSCLVNMQQPKKVLSSRSSCGP